MKTLIEAWHNNTLNKIVITAIPLFVIICCCCYPVTSAILSPTSPTPTIDVPALRTASVQTVAAELTASAPTITLTLTFTAIPATLQPTTTNSQIATATLAPLPSKTLLPTATLPIIAPTQPPAQAICSCSGDLYNCNSFKTRSQAQSCFDYCKSQGRGDVHRLDRDGDGRVCESLP